jgi:hypothetical protein
MDDQQVEELRQWAITTTAWERAIAEERGTKLRPIKGVRKMNAALKEIFKDRKRTPKVRGLAAAETITLFVTESYGVAA